MAIARGRTHLLDFAVFAQEATAAPVTCLWLNGKLSEWSISTSYTQHSPPARKGKIPRPNRGAPSEQIGLAQLQVPFNQRHVNWFQSEVVRMEYQYPIYTTPCSARDGNLGSGILHLIRTYDSNCLTKHSDLFYTRVLVHKSCTCMRCVLAFQHAYLSI